MYNDHKTDYDKYDSREAFKKEMNKIANDDLSKELEKETKNLGYEEIKKTIIR